MEAVLAARRIHKNETIATHAVERLFSVCLGKNWNPRTKFSYQTYMLLRANGAILQMTQTNKREFLLSRHSEKRAIAFGLIRSDHEIPVRVVKNLLMCSDWRLPLFY
ncbi:pentatricopeptide repeat-containing At3g22690 [Olea europaea subsp. europaea]|uniref:Pentatricopeptide repeat-containing At3g22690 n=1 Tax=Olea europaea subsp. europaea TaxID=158383 RepID=A0A8S0U063_OLEEU|nr:pentatricopeptide repeat-containing At3g22690 [Olea europaea subsp. europaea]